MKFDIKDFKYHLETDAFKVIKFYKIVLSLKKRILTFQSKTDAELNRNV